MSHDDTPFRPPRPTRRRDPDRQPPPVADGPHRGHRPGHGQHHRCRDLQPADVARRLRPDHPRLDGAHDGRCGRAGAVVRGVVAAAPRRTADRTRTRGSRSATGSASRTRGRTGSPRGPATPRSRSAGCCTSRCSSTRARTSWSRSCSCWSACGSRPLINLSGVKNMGSVQVWTTILKFAALAFMSTVGLFYITARQLHAVEHQRRKRHRARSAAAWRSRCSATSASRSPRSPRPRCEDPDRNIPEGDDLRHARHRRRLHALAHRGVRHPAVVHAAKSDRAVLGRGQRHVRRQLGGQRHGDRRDHLRLRRTERLDHDLRRDAARRGERRAVPRTVQAPFDEQAFPPSASSPPPRSHRSR